MNRARWVPAVQWLLWGVLMSLAMGWMARSRARPRPAASEGRLAHPRSTLVVGLVGFALFAGIAIASNVWSNETTTIWTTLIFVGFALLAAPMIADYYLARHEVSESGMEYGRLTGRRGSLRWSELTRVRYAPQMKWFTLDRSSGQRVRVSAMLTGLPEFARQLLAHAPAGAIDQPTRAVLEETAAGRPPSIWQ